MILRRLASSIATNIAAAQTIEIFIFGSPEAGGRYPRRSTRNGLPGITKLEVRIGVLVAVPNGVMVRCVDVHSGRPVSARRLSVRAGIRNLSKRR
jgi:hypothetical protein